MLSDTRVSIRLTPGCRATQHPGVRYAETRVSDKLYFHGKKVMDAIEEIFIGYIFFHLVECKSHFLFFP
jgi:hypothetical protein